MFPHKLQYKELDHDLTYASVLESNVAADWKKWERGKGEENEEEGRREGRRKEREKGEEGEGRKGRRRGGGGRRVVSV